MPSIVTLACRTFTTAKVGIGSNNCLSIQCLLAKRNAAALTRENSAVDKKTSSVRLEASPQGRRVLKSME